MKQSVLKIAWIVLALLIGISGKVVWDYRQQIHDFWTKLFVYYQD
jgi:tryptophan-rich sensory protein